MRTKIYNLSLAELNISIEEVASLMGYTSEVPDIIEESFYKELKRFKNTDEICGGLSFSDSNVSIEKNLISFQEKEFNVGRQVAHYFKNSEQIISFICTAGKTISERSKELMSSGDLLEGYVVDVMGSVIVEKAMDKIQQKLKGKYMLENMSITNRYSPGYCGWDVAEQTKLFSLFPKDCCSIKLSESCLMSPIKSVSGFIGIGKEVKYREYTCNHCSNTNCIYRNKKTY